MFFSTKLLYTTTLISKKTFKSAGMNCFSFAGGLVPAIGSDYPNPGGSTVRKIRDNLIFELEPNFVRKFQERQTQALARVLDSHKINSKQSIRTFLINSASKNLKNFAIAYFEKGFSQMDDGEFKQLYSFLVDGYEVDDNKLTKSVFMNLLRLENFVKVFPNDQNEILPHLSNEIVINTTLMAAFLTKPQKKVRMYHFLRFFKEGWYECLGDEVLLKGQCNKILFDTNDMIEKYFQYENEMDFCGYYLAPPGTEMADKIGRIFTFESHKMK